MTDRYTKTVLTIIAGCLLIIVVRGGVPGVTPAIGEGQTHVYIDGVSPTAFLLAGPLSVRCESGCR
jgi:hypothetical protein